jgi:TRAP-type C4-dicarboxylate transport system substrate-binding protein
MKANFPCRSPSFIAANHARTQPIEIDDEEEVVGTIRYMKKQSRSKNGRNKLSQSCDRMPQINQGCGRILQPSGSGRQCAAKTVELILRRKKQSIEQNEREVSFMNFKVTAGALALALSTAISTPAQAAERLIFNCFFPPKHYVCTEFMPELKNRIETATEGRVKVNTPPKSLSAPPDQYDGVVGGVMDGALQFNAFIANQVPGIQFSLLPFVGSTHSEVAGPALWETYQKFFADKNEYGEAKLISVYASSGNELYSLTDEPIMTATDIGSRKMWGLPGVVANTLKGTGSSVVAGPAVQMLEIISKGVVDGYAGVPWGSVQAFKLGDYTKSATELERKLFQPTFSFVVSNAKWDKISAEDQVAIMTVMGADYAKWAGAFQDKVNTQARANMMEAGVAVHPGSKELENELRALGQPMIDAWIAKADEMGVDGQEIIDFYLARIAEGEAALSN